MKIVIINKSNSLGGAAVVSSRLMAALIAEGANVDMLVMQCNGASTQEHITEYGNNLKGKAYFLAERLDIFIHNHFSRKNLFKVSTASLGFDLSKHPLVVGADIVVLNWVNQGAISLQGIEKISQLGKPIFWIMHDMWECTGICHHALECNRYKRDCGACNYLQSSNDNDISHKTQLAKKRLYRSCKINFIAVSNWLARKCKESSLLGDQSVTVIPNAFHIDKFDSHYSNHFPELPEGKKIIVMGAARLDDDIKGFPILIDAMNEIARNRPELAEKVHLLLYGGIKDAALIYKIELPHTYIGSVSTDRIPEIYASSHIVVSTSLYETLPGTLIEGAAAGCIPVTFGNGGQEDIAQHLTTGYIAEYKSPSSIADGIEWAVASAPDRESLHTNIRNRFAATTVARRYLSLFATALSK